MSDREDSPEIAENGSDHLSAGGKTSSVEDAHSAHEEGAKRSRSRSRSHSRSRSYSRRRHSYSRSSPPEKAEELELDGLRSHSRSRRYSRRSRSRSRSPQRYSRSRSRSRSYTPRRSYSPQYSPRHSYYGGGGDDRDYKKSRRDYSHSRSYNRSPMSSRRRHQGNRVSSTTRDNPEPSRCLGVFGLSLYTQERDLKDVLGKYGPIEDVQIVYDAQTGRSRGFAFVYFEEVEDAKAAKERCNGQEIDGRKIRVDYSITKRAHTPTPGIYMGKPTYSKYSNRNGGYRDGGFRGHSPYYSRGHRYSRSRSRSYSPHRYDYY